MSRRTLPTALTAVVSFSALASVIFGQDNPQPDTRSHRPILISPGGQNHEGQVGNGCPTFSWTLLAEAKGYEFRVYELNAIDDAPPPTAEPRLRKQFPEGATSWTPETPECLPAGRYAWAVATLGGDGPPRWSLPGRFRVSAAPPLAHLEPQRRDESMASAIVTTMPPLLEAGSLGTGLTRLTADAYTPPVCGAGRFADVPPGSAFCTWIEQLDRDGIMTSCDGGSNFCPDNPVTRKQLAAFLGMSMRGTATWHPAQGSNWLAPPVGNASTTVDDAGDVGQYDAIAIGVDGLPIISYYDNTVEALKVAHCNDVACAAPATITTVDNNGNLGGYSSIAIGSDGLPVISYWDTTVDLDNGIRREALKVAHCNDVACAGQDETLTFVDDPENNNVGLYTSIAIGGDGLPIISYIDATAGALWVAHCNDVDCNPVGVTRTAVDASGVNVDYTSITIGADSQPIISYKKGAALYVAYCTDWYCASHQNSMLFDFSPQVFTMSTPITIDARGLPLIALRHPAGSFLALVHCNDRACSGGNETLNLVATLVRANSALTIGVDGLPFISHDNTGSLRIVHCNDPICQGNDEVVNPMFTSNVGDWNAVTFGVDGLPVISYYDSSLGALRVIHCANVFCTPYFRRR